jgi:hypothetical protein
MTPPSKTTTAPRKPSPTPQVHVLFLLSHYIVYYGKKTGQFCSKLRREKPIFECTIGTQHFVIFPLNEYNDGHLLWQGLLVVLVPMIVYSAKRLASLVQILARIVHFLTS